MSSQTLKQSTQIVLRLITRSVMAVSCSHRPQSTQSGIQVAASFHIPFGHTMGGYSCGTYRVASLYSAKAVTTRAYLHA